MRLYKDLQTGYNKSTDELPGRWFRVSGNFKAIIIDAGPGDMTLGLTQAGFRVEAVYEKDASEVMVHQANFKIPVCLHLTQEKEYWEAARVDLLAVRLNLSRRTPSIGFDPSLDSFLELLNRSRPRTFLAMLNADAIVKDGYRLLVDQIAQAGYWFTYKKLDAAEITGFPVQDRKVFLIGVREEEEQRVGFPEPGNPVSKTPEYFLEPIYQIDPWYFRIRRDEDVPLQEGTRFYCWSGHGYTGTDRVKWNPRIVPLVWNDGILHKITHREIANLKGFPHEYALPIKDKNRLYTKLMYAGNVIVIRQVAEMIRSALEECLWRNPQIERVRSFEKLLNCYLTDRTKPALIQWNKSKTQSSFTVKHNGESLHIDAKSYSSATVPEARLVDACKRLRRNDKADNWVLAVANKVPSSLKSEIREKYGVYIWDVANLLWLFDGHEEIKNEFIALLDYTVEGIKPEPPYPNPFQEDTPEPPETEGKETAPSLKKQLDQIVPGPDHAANYESFCVEFLKSVLNAYLTLWKTQEKSNGGLYRFDLCCKIKMGADGNSEFFDTIQRYFNTKYIVFEFKNYSDRITQKEIYTTEKYLYEKALRKVAIVISRKGVDDHAEQAVRGCLRETGKLILCLSDRDLLRMNALAENGEGDPVDVLGEKLDALLIDLEK